MGRYLSEVAQTSSGVAQISGGVPGLNNGTARHHDFPITGVFGSGAIRFFMQGDYFTVPESCTKVRARVWGAGGSAINNAQGCGGGGFAMKVITGLTPGQKIPVTVGMAQNGGSVSFTSSSSFGTFVSATGGLAVGTGGVGSGGDLNFSGGTTPSAANSGGSGAASVWGNGGCGAGGTVKAGEGCSGGGAGGGAYDGTKDLYFPGGNGLFGLGGEGGSTTTVGGSGKSLIASFSIDYLGTGGGGGVGGGGGGAGLNGGGGGFGTSGFGGFPGGGAGGSGVSAPRNLGGNGLVIVEW